MPEFIGSPTQIETVGNMAKIVEEYFGLINSEDSKVSVAIVNSPAGWVGLGQRPDFEEYTVVLKGSLTVEHEGGSVEVGAGQAVRTGRHEWVRYSTPGGSGAQYVAVCVPAFTRATVHRDY